MRSLKTLIKRICEPGQEEELINELKQLKRYLAAERRDKLRNFEFKELEKHTYERHSIKKSQTTNF